MYSTKAKDLQKKLFDVAINNQKYLQEKILITEIILIQLFNL